MPVTLTTSGRSLDLRVSREELLRDLGDLALRLIRTRTEKQIDVHGARFRALSPAYAKRKAAAGLGTEPNLQVSGRMLNDMAIVEVTDTTVSLGFVSSGGTAPHTGRGKRGTNTSATFIQKSRAIGAADKAFFHTEVGAGRSQVKREFFALSADDEQRLEDALDRFFDRVLE